MMHTSRFKGLGTPLQTSVEGHGNGLHQSFDTGSDAKVVTLPLFEGLDYGEQILAAEQAGHAACHFSGDRRRVGEAERIGQTGHDTN